MSTYKLNATTILISIIVNVAENTLNASPEELQKLEKALIELWSKEIAKDALQRCIASGNSTFLALVLNNFINVIPSTLESDDPFSILFSTAEEMVNLYVDRFMPADS